MHDEIKEVFRTCAARKMAEDWPDGGRPPEFRRMSGSPREVRAGFPSAS